jgi:hypothetical protein
MTKITSNDALYMTEDWLNRSFIDFLLLGETARTLIQGFHSDLDGGIELGVLKKDYTESGKRVFESLLPRDTKITENLITFNQGEIPVKIRIIHRNYQFFKNPEHIIHKISDFCVPNPFEGYWKARNLIQ